jgi:hypothetical protein
VVIEKEEGKHIVYFDADLVNSEGMLFKIDQDNGKSHQVNMVTTIFYDSYDELEEKFTKEEGKDTDSEDPEDWNPDLKYMKHRVQQFLRVDKEEDTYDKLMMKYDFRCYGCKRKMLKMVDDYKERYICRWCTELERIQSPTIQECLSCGCHGPEGYECAFCWTRDHPMVEGDEPKTVIAGLKYYLKNQLVHRNDSHMKNMRGMPIHDISSC